MDEGLTLDAVTVRFAESERLLTTVRERLERIVDAEERADVSSTNLATAADEVRAFVAVARDALQELSSSQRQARQVLDAGARMLDGTALAELQGSVAELKQQFSARLDELEQRVADRTEAEARASAAEAELEQLRGAHTAAEARVAELERLIEHFKQTKRRAFEQASRSFSPGG